MFKFSLVAEFITDYYKNIFPNIRLGQAFVNKFNIEDKFNLFYLEDNNRAEDIIWNNYTTWVENT